MSFSFPPYVPVTPGGQDMLRMEPNWIRNSPVLSRLLDVFGSETDTFGIWTADMMAQLFVRTSTWGLEYWEAELGIGYGGALTDDQRADRIVAKLRSYRQATPFVIRLVANSWGDNGLVDPIESFSERKLIIRFISTRGLPPNITDLQDALERLVRASALLVWEFTYLTWGEVFNAGPTWQDLKDAGLTWSEIMTMRPEDLP